MKTTRKVVPMIALSLIFGNAALASGAKTSFWDSPVGRCLKTEGGRVDGFWATGTFDHVFQRDRDGKKGFYFIGKNRVYYVRSKNGAMPGIGVPLRFTIPGQHLWSFGHEYVARFDDPERGDSHPVVSVGGSDDSEFRSARQDFWEVAEVKVPDSQLESEFTSAIAEKIQDRWQKNLKDCAFDPVSLKNCVSRLETRLKTCGKIDDPKVKAAVANAQPIVEKVLLRLNVAFRSLDDGKIQASFVTEEGKIRELIDGLDGSGKPRLIDMTLDGETLTDNQRAEVISRHAKLQTEIGEWVKGIYSKGANQKVAE